MNIRTKIANYESSAKDALDKLAKEKVILEELDVAMEKEIDKVFTKSIRSKVDEIKATYAESRKDIEGRIAELDAKARTNILMWGDSVKGSFLNGIYSVGKVSWDSKRLEVLAKSVPEIQSCRKQGEPFVTIRKI